MMTRRVLLTHPSLLVLLLPLGGPVEQPLVFVRRRCNPFPFICLCCCDPSNFRLLSRRCCSNYV